MGTQEREDSRVIHVFNVIPSRPPAEPIKERLSKRWIYSQMTRAFLRKLIRTPFSIHTWAALRRTALASFLPDNLIYRYKAYQRGECNRCGLCCKIQFQCPFLVDEGPFNTHCSVYTNPAAPSACVKFPLDPLDLKLLQREVGHACTFYYEGEPQRLSILEFVRLYTGGVRQQLARRKLNEAPDGAD